jgi:hypothetical protein
MLGLLMKRSTTRMPALWITTWVLLHWLATLIISSSDAGSAWEGYGLVRWSFFSIGSSLSTYDVRTIPAFRSDLVDEHDTDLGGRVHSRLERARIPVNNATVGTSFSLQSIQRCVNERRCHCSRSTASDHSAYNFRSATVRISMLGGRALLDSPL